jgi:hypothetical protein
MAQTAAASTCTRPQQVMERFIDADCEACWSSPAQAPAPNGAWVMDWIVPGASGSEAPLALAALDEARARRDAVQALKPLPASGEADWRLPARPPLRLAVAGGPAWNGYLGLQLQVRGSAPAGARAYLALVEDVPADAEGNASARRLVRAVAGPIALGDAPASELRALRIPEGAKPERLLGMAWWVDRDERLLGITAEGCPREK